MSLCGAPPVRWRRDGPIYGGMNRDRRPPVQPHVWRPQGDERGAVRSTWQPSFRDESRDWSRQLSEEMRPLVESLQRLRDRGLLE